MAWHPSERRLVHPLPRAPQFVGGKRRSMRSRNYGKPAPAASSPWSAWADAGKTAIAARFLEELSAGDSDAAAGRGSSCGAFIKSPMPGFPGRAASLFTPEFPHRPGERSRADPSFEQRAWARAEPHLLVLDGLERVQRGEGHAPGVFGQIEDPLLKGLLTRLAEAWGKPSRWSQADSRWRICIRHSDKATGKSTSSSSATTRRIELLRHHGVHGDERRSRIWWIRTVPCPDARSPGGLIGQFLGGDPARAPAAPQFASPEHDRQALRLARLLKAYEEHLPPEELALLCRLCLLERSVQVDQIVPLFLCSPAVHFRTAGELISEFRTDLGTRSYSPELLLELSDAVREAVTEALVEHPIAGPDQLFRDNITQAIVGLEEHFEGKGEAWSRKLSSFTRRRISTFRPNNAR